MIIATEKFEKISLGVSIAAMVFLIYEKYFADNPLGFEIQLTVAVLAYLLVAYDVVYHALKTLIKQRRMTEQFLMMIATFGAFGLCDLPEALAVMVFYKIGEIFEDYAQGRAHTEISSLIKLRPQQVRVIQDDGSEKIVKPREVKIGDVIRVIAGETVAIDGYLKEDSASLDCRALTGESAPRVYRKGQVVPSGCINEGSVFHLTVSTLHKNSSITRLLNLIEDAASNKSRPEDLIRRFSVWYTPVVVLSACLLALMPLFLKDAVFADWLERALVFLVVSCPCALVLSVPLTYFGGMGAISRIGVIVKGSVYLEALSKLKALAFDKTGTLTKDDFKVIRIEAKDKDEKALIQIAASVEAQSGHPVARSIKTYAKENNISLLSVEEVAEKAGLGIEGSISGSRVCLGRYEYIKEKCDDAIESTDAISSVIYVCENGSFKGCIYLFDSLKDEAKEAVDEIKAMGLATCLITGDREQVALKVSEDLRLDKSYSRMTPQGKIDAVNELKQKYRTVGFVGDGLNDAPVLSLSTVGIAMGDIGSACAIEAADVVIMHGDLKAIAKCIRLAKKTCSLAMSNMVFVLAVKLMILILGAFGLANIWLAVFGDVGVLVLAVLNAMRTMRFR